MRILGFETSCDDTAVSVIEIKDQIVSIESNVISSQISVHEPYGGVVPSLAAREHLKNLNPVLTEALARADTTLEDIDLIATTSGPGLISSLLVGTTFAKTLAWKFKKPIIGVNHIEGHIYSNFLENKKDKNNALGIMNSELTEKTDIFPILCLIVSGGHTELILMKNHGEYELIGRTVDDASGEAFDKIARLLELDYPGGPVISKLAEGFDPADSPVKISLPRPMLHSKDFNFSFSGLKTSVLYYLRDHRDEYSWHELQKAVAYEAQNAIVETLVTKTIKAAKRYKIKTVLLAGGVSANKLLRKNLGDACRKNCFDYLEPNLAYTTDNAAMIALAGYFNYKKLEKENRLGETDWSRVRADANWELV